MLRRKRKNQTPTVGGDSAHLKSDQKAYETVYAELDDASNDPKSLDRDENYKQLETFIFGGLLTSEAQDAVQDDDNDSDVDKDDENTSETKPKPLWSDDDDDAAAAPQQCAQKRMRCIEFEKVMGPTPDWAKAPARTDDQSSLDILDTALLSRKSRSLPDTTIDMKRCTDLNKSRPSLSKLEACEFHRSARIAMTAAQDCHLNLFQVDGKKNAKIHSLFMDKYPIRCAHFLENGREVLMSSNLAWMHSYDMATGKVVKIPYVKGVPDRKLVNFKVSPGGKHLIFLSSFGKMHVVDARTKELVTTLKMNGSVEDVAFFDDGDSMLSIGDDATVYVWDMSTRQCVTTFADEGSVHGTSIAVSPSATTLACGSSSGIVNFYSSSSLRSSPPTLLRSFKNLRTPVSRLRFNPSGEMLAMASDQHRGAVKLAHVGSLSVFENFPSFKDKGLSFVRQVDFSPGGGYMAAGDSRGRALLYRLDHYGDY